MKVVILAGGFGTRISEKTSVIPKPLVQIGSKPILWHIMKIYSSFGFNEFIICCGYKGYFIKEFFANYFMHHSDVTFDLKNNKMNIVQNNIEPWVVTLVDTGENTMTGGRIKRIQNYTKGERFMMTYGDGVSDVNLKELLEFHKSQKTIATVTSVQPPQKFGVFNLDSKDTLIRKFIEKPKAEERLNSTWINGGFFVLEPEIFDFIEGDTTVFEKEPLERLASRNQLSAFRHNGYWQSMDTLNDKNILEKIWNSGKAPWKKW